MGFDMGVHSEMLPADVREDVAAALAQVAQNDETARLLCIGLAVTALVSLMRDSLQSVALPAAQALQSLAQLQDAKHLFMHHGLTDLVSDRLDVAPGSFHRST